MSELAQIGATIVQSFTSKLGQWATAVTPQGQLSTMDVRGLCQLADDLAQFHKSWTAFSALEDNFQHGFFPETADPLALEAPTNDLEHDSTSRAPIVNRLENLPFAAGASHPFFEIQQSRDNKTLHAGTSDSQPSSSSSQFPRHEPAEKVNAAPPNHPMFGQKAASYQKSNSVVNAPVVETTKQPFEPQRTPAVANRKDASYFDTPATDLKTSETQSEGGSTPFNMPKIPLDVLEPAKPASMGGTLDTIWQRPLQNLGDFASGFHQYAHTQPPQKPDGSQQAHQPTPQQSDHSVNTPRAGMGQETFLPRSTFPMDQSVSEATTTMPLALPEQPIWEEPPISMVTPRNSNRPFEATAEAILEALTRQLVRDFKRYYPD